MKPSGCSASAGVAASRFLEVADLEKAAMKPDPAELKVSAVGNESIETEEAGACPGSVSLRRERRRQRVLATRERSADLPNASMLEVESASAKTMNC